MVGGTARKGDDLPPQWFNSLQAGPEVSSLSIIPLFRAYTLPFV